MTQPVRTRTAHAIAVALSLVVFIGATGKADARAAPMWIRLDLVENAAEGPAFDRCQIEAALEKTRTEHVRVFFGEVRAEGEAGWSAIRPSSGCARAGADASATSWAVRGVPYFMVDITLGKPGVSEREAVIEAVFSIRTLTGFPQGGDPAYETRTETRTLRVPDGGSTLVPLLIASRKETDEFGVRELFLKFRAGAVGSRPKVEYGELAVTADTPRAEIFLDGGLVGRTSSDGPVVLSAVRVGQREVIVRDASGREAHATARVAKGQREGLTLALMKGIAASSDGLRPLGPNRQGGEEFWRDKDGAIVVRIPGGEDQMGSPESEGEASEHPLHAVRVDGFLIDKTEVTWGQYARFLAESGRRSQRAPIWGTPEAFPASSISWDEARAFCAWAGGRLPTEAEWERAATGGGTRQFPWGDTFDPWRCNTRDGGPHAPTPAAAFPDCVSPFGVLDLAGGVSEWCADWYDEGYYAKSPAQNPAGPEAGTQRALRGGGWMSSSFAVRSAARLGIEPEWTGPMQGFRCAQNERKAEAVPPSDAPSRSKRIEVRLELVANRVDGRVESCETVLAKDASSDVSLAAWSTLGATGGEPGGLKCRIRDGAFFGASPTPALIQEISVDAGWSPGAMDPGPFGAFQIFLKLTSRDLAGVAVKAQRNSRLEPGEELFVPIPIDDASREALGVRELLLRVRAGWAGRDGATEYGALAVSGAAPRSEIVLDGGVAGRAGADGTLSLANVPVGQHEVHVRGASGPVVLRVVSVPSGRTVLLTPAPGGTGSPPQPSLVRTSANHEGFQEYRRARDGATMIEIPEGDFLMGNLAIEGAPTPHTVNVSSFLIDKLPLTVDRFKRFAAATGRPLPPDPYWGVHDDFPVAFVRWEDAKAYCEWAGGRLPTEAEREKAARGTDGRMFPWGSEPPSPERAVFGRNWGQEGNDAAGVRPSGASPYGLLDSEGNMWEFCEDWWDPEYYKVSPKKDPQGPKTGVARVVRGGSWDSRWVALSASRRNFAYVGYREGDFGFRCASDLPPISSSARPLASR